MGTAGGDAVVDAAPGPSAAGTAAAIAVKAAQRLEAASAEDRADAALDLVRLASLDADAGVRAAVAARLTHERPEVRQAALKVAGGLAKAGDAEALADVLAAFADSNERVRRAAAHALGELSETLVEPEVPAAEVVSNCTAMIDAAIGHLGHERWEVRVASVLVLGQLAGHAPVSKAGSALAAPLRDARAEVRRAAGRALVGLVDARDADAVCVVVAASADDRGEVRKAMAPLLKKLPGKGTAKNITAVATLLKEEKWEVRYAAVFAIGRLARMGNPEPAARRAAIGALADGRTEVRVGAAEALRRMSCKGSISATTALLERLADDAPNVRAKAVSALSAIAEKGHAGTVAALLKYLEGPRREVRVAALRVLRNVATKGDATVMAAVTACLQDMEEAVRWDAALALRGIAPLGHAATLAALEARLGDESWAVRFWVIWAMWGLAVKGYGSIQGAVLAVLCAAALGGIMAGSGRWRNSAPDVPFRSAGEPSLLGWALSLLLKVLTGGALMQLALKGKHSTAGTLVALISAMAVGVALAEVFGPG